MTQTARLGDLRLVTGFVVLATIIFAFGRVPDPLAWALGIPFLLVVPGYVYVSALFPRAPATDPTTAVGPGWIIRLALSLVLSVLIVSVVGAVLGAVGLLQRGLSIAAVSAVTVTGIVIAAFRRRNVALDQCANPLNQTYGGSFGQTPYQSAVMVIALVSLLGAIVFTGAVLSQGESYTEFYILNETDDGELIAGGHPPTLVADDGHDMHLAVENEEGEPVRYDVVVTARTNDTDPELLDRFEVELADGERATIERTITPSTVANETQLEFLLFKGGTSTPVNPNDADKSLQLWVDVVDSHNATESY